MSKEKLEIEVEKAITGDRKALEKVIVSIKDMVYNLSLRMLLYPEDAKDATQEILIKIMTSLSTFKGNSAFKTWVYRVASNYLINAKGKNAAVFKSSFEDYALLLDSGLSETISYTQNQGEQNLLEEEVKVSCTHGLLLCLNEQSRLVYILAEILEFNSVEGAEILDISSDNFRKILSRSRSQIRNFLQSKCGLVNPENPCRCTKKIDFLIDQNIINPISYRFAQHTDRSIDLFRQIGDLEKSVAVYRSTPMFSTPDVVIKKIKQTLNLI